MRLNQQSTGLGRLGDDDSTAAGGASPCSAGISTELAQLSLDVQAGNYSGALLTDTIFCIPVWVYLAVVGAFWLDHEIGEHRR